MEGQKNNLEVVPELRYAHLAPEVSKALSLLERAGWVKRGLKNVESVQEHTLSLRLIAITIPSLNRQDKQDLMDMLEIHDWPEAINGDELAVSNNQQELVTMKKNKFIREAAAMGKICSELKEDQAKQIMDLWNRFESASDEIAELARQIDKFQSVEKALFYERTQNLPVFQEFRDYYNASITHPFLLERLKKLDKEHALIKILHKD